MEKVDAIIEDAKICKISDLWKRKPKGLQFNDTDALIITAKTEDGKTIKETFYFCLKPDGTFNVDTVSRNGSHVRRQKLADFLKHYKMTDTIKGYKISEDVEKWKGKSVKVVPYKDSGYIHVP
ncbi:MAG: hypothetical protein QMD78_01280 [Methanocellales archaeon]|nr:hypothetical protein [Methanocellales archaeon]